MTFQLGDISVLVTSQVFPPKDIDDMRNISGLLTLNKIGDILVLMEIQF